MRSAARLSPDERFAYQLGVRHFERGEDDAAIGHLTRLVATRPRFADVHYLLGLLYERRGDLEEAVHRLEAAVALNPGYAEARLALAAVCERRGDFDRSEAVVFSAPAAEDGGRTLTQAKLANLQAALGDAYREAGELGEAVAAYRKALDRCPTFLDVRYRLAVALREHGLPDQALRELDRVLRANPGYVDAIVQRGLTLWSLGQADRAAAAWRDVVRLEPDRPDAPLYLRLVVGEGAADGERIASAKRSST
jgi:tetratricopeptide (TPR) repeat protein